MDVIKKSMCQCGKSPTQNPIEKCFKCTCGKMVHSVGGESMHWYHMNQYLPKDKQSRRIMRPSQMSLGRGR